MSAANEDLNKKHFTGKNGDVSITAIEDAEQLDI
jgi:hypothetical protein